MVTCFNLVEEILQAITRVMMGAPDPSLRKKAFSALKKARFYKAQHSKINLPFIELYIT